MTWENTYNTGILWHTSAIRFFFFPRNRSFYYLWVKITKVQHINHYELMIMVTYIIFFRRWPRELWSFGGSVHDGLFIILYRIKRWNSVGTIARISFYAPPPPSLSLHTSGVHCITRARIFTASNVLPDVWKNK